MADRELRINTALDNSGIIKGVRDAGREIKKLTTKFDDQMRSVERQKVALEGMRRQLEAINSGEKAPASLTAMETQLKKISKEYEKQLENQQALFNLSEKAEQNLEEATKSNDTKNIEKYTKEVAKFDKEIENLEKTLTDLYDKSEQLAGKISSVKLDPSTSREAQNWADKIKLAEDELKRSQVAASQTKQEISNISASAGQTQQAISNVGTAAKASAAISVNAFKGLRATIGTISTVAHSVAKTAFSAFKKVGSVIGTMSKGATKAAKGIFALSKNLLFANRSAKTTSKGFLGLANKMWSMIKTVAVFNLVRKALTALRDTVGRVLIQNDQFAASWNAIQVNLLTAFAPLWEVVQPAILTFMDLLARFTSVLAQFMATLFGKTYKQAKASAKSINDQSKAVDKLGKSAKNATAPFDDLTIIASDLSETELGENELDFEAVEPPDFSWIDSIIIKLNEIFDVFKEAWENAGKPLVDAFIRAKDEIIELFKEIALSFEKVWTDGTGLIFLESILRLLTTILQIIGDMAKAFKEAWVEGKTGEILIQTIFGLLTNVCNLLNSIGEAFRKAWNDNGTGKSLISAILKLLTNIFGTISDIANAFKTAFDNKGTELLSSILNLIKEIILIINDITTAFRNAWNENDRGVKLVEALFNMFSSINRLLISIGESFREAWNGGIGEAIIGNILEILTNVFNTIGTIAAKLQEAWEANGNGVAIWQTILGIINDVLTTINSMSLATLEWANELNLEPIVTAYRNLLEAMRPFIDITLDGLEWVYTSILLPLSKWAIETLIPTVLDTISAAFTALTAAVEALKPLAMWIWEEFLQPIAAWTGETIINALNLLRDALNGTVQPLQNVEQGYGELESRLKMASITHLIDGLVDTLFLLVETVSSEIPALFDTFKTVFDDISNLVLAPFGESLMSDIIPTFNGFINEAIQAWDVLFIEVKEIFDKLWKEAIAPVLDEIGKIWSDLWDSISAAWSEHGQPIFDAINTAIQSISETLQMYWDEYLGPIWDTLVQAIDDLWTEHLKPLVDEILDFAGTFVEAALKIYNEFIDPIVKWIIQYIAPIVQKYIGLGINAIKLIIGVIIDACKATVEAFKGIINFITAVFSGDWEAAWDAIKDIFDAFGKYLVDIWEGVGEFIIELLDSLVGIFEDTWVLIKEVWGRVSTWFEENVITPLKDAFKEGINFLIGLAEGFANSFIKAINFIIDAFNKLSFEVPDWVPIIGGQSFGFGIPSVSEIAIPRLAKGGIVDSATIAMIGEKGREAVVPLENNTGWFDELNEGNYLLLQELVAAVHSLRAEVSALRDDAANHQTVIDMNGTTVARTFTPYLGAESKRIGGSISNKVTRVK